MSSLVEDKAVQADLAGNAEQASQLLAAMANPKRLLILCNLVGGEMAVGALATTVDLSQSALSQHLAKLRALKLVKTRRDAQTIYYSLASHEVQAVLETLYGLYCEPPTKD
ncbi:ArsR/SmtB family transcription factor [Hoeflea prorocentri]|uniref:Metalloregulator ArsR/SmtB family transcription factor n=1 Tax=Hoeflea prorocentri TaxID=1922333 RepID=A0A9X3ZG32_9HYPH|nr:metalloregulator ArsR/SmtB family transcription factor [Hoeflea prorocentri]MCY6379498.1 metalloregulator ArsR/SmtB family transcription factor [Hoeflea prorocentri]MDA5397298.1 metalloregulator ArsR/SmtB family transcription factor [Hoeflea prorocentri]